MGCDIHLYFEQKNMKGEWEEVKVDERILPDDRDYRLFTFLAGVRNYDDFEIEPQFPKRGIPEDTSMPKKETEYFFMGDHSFTYAYVNEILEAPWEKYELNDSYFKIFCEYVLPRLSSVKIIFPQEDKKNIRVIMGFDN